MKSTLAAFSLLAVLAVAADPTTCQTKCIASNLCAGVTDYLDSSCICSDDFQQNVKGCLYSGNCGNDVGSWFEYAESACAAASAGAGSATTPETSAGAEAGASIETASAAAASGKSGKSSSTASVVSAAPSSTGASTNGANVAQTPLVLAAAGLAGALLL